ncbi:ChbG/HpnK family deacetylase [Paucidesulfovibrio longus]|uniref:ChbG/HpnK family deacetylase n=1 Tax=Paucidesulfovibrio longus TaxID=889 RepID=UPI00058EF01B|nr:ChbG/HpnK family deacetylase [Paucidesulfovibrio longus]
MFIIVNVDDLGLHPAVRRAVVALSTEGIVTSSTLMANGPDLEESARIGGVGLGVHMNVLRGRSVLQPRLVSSLLGDDDLFLGDYGKLMGRYFAGRVDLRQVESEWAAQIEKIMDLGVRPTHLDSEKHIHAWPGMMAVAGRLAERYGIRWVRRPRECAGLLRFDKGGLRTKFLNVCALMQKKPEAVSWPDRIWGIADQGERLLPDAFKEYMAGSNDRVVEICCHPGDPQEGDPPLPVEFGAMRVGSQWSVEFDRLSDPRWRDVLREMDARLVHYGQIRPEDIE